MDNNNQLKLLYEELYECTQKMCRLIEENDLDEINSLIIHRDGLLSNVSSVRMSNSQPETDEIKELTVKITELEQKNLEAYEQNFAKVKAELAKVSKNAKVLEAYAYSKDNTGDLLDYRE